MMRCVDVIEELAAPTGPGSAALAEHLATCPRCAAWARRDARLDRLWEATRPGEPSPAAWANLWASVTQAHDAGATPAPQSIPVRPSIPLRPATAARPWKRRAWATFALAQAAVLLVAAWLVSRPDAARPPSPHGPRPTLALKPAQPAVPESVVSTPEPPSPRTPPTPVAKIEIDYGALVMIRSDGEGVKVVGQLGDEGSNAVDATFVEFGILEAMAE